MIANKFLSLPNMTKIQVFYIQKMTKILVIDKHKNFVIIIFWVMPPCFKNFDNC